MLPYIALAVTGLVVLAAGIILIIRRKKAVGITLTVLGAAAGLTGAFLTVCTFILVDYIRNRQADEPPAVTEITEDIFVESENDLTGEIGNDWRTTRSYSDNIVISDELTVCLSVLDDTKGYAVYDSSDGNRIASLISDSSSGLDLWNVTASDLDGDGVNEIGAYLTNGETLWFRYNGRTWNEENPSGCFERTEG